MKANIEIAPGKWLMKRLPRVRDIKDELRRLVKSDAARLALILASGGMTLPWRLADYAFQVDPREMWWAPESVLPTARNRQIGGKGRKRRRFDCEDYGRALAALARATGYDPEAEVEIIELPTTLHAVGRIRGQLADISGHLETGGYSPVTSASDLRRFGAVSGLYRLE